MQISRGMCGSQVYEEPSWKLSYRDDRMVGSKESRFCQELAEPPGGWHPGSGRFGVGWGGVGGGGWAGAGPKGSTWARSASEPAVTCRAAHRCLTV